MTDKFISAKGCTLAFSEETEYGTAVTPTRPIGVIQNWSIDERRNVTQTYGQGSSSVIKLSDNEYDVTGSCSVTLQRIEIIEYLLGTPIDAGSGPYTHTISTISESVKSITLGYGMYDANSETMLLRQQIKGVRIKKIDIVCNENREVSLNIDWEGRECAHDDTSLVPVFMANETIFSSKMWTFKISDAGGSPAHRTTVTNATVSINRDLAKGWGNGSVLPLFKDIDKCSLKVTGSEFFTDKTIYEDFMGSASGVGSTQTDKKIELEISNDGTTTALRKIVVVLDNCKKTDGFRINQPSSTSFIKTNFAYDGHLSSFVATDNTEDWNA